MNDTTWRVLLGDVRARLADLPDASVQCVITSPPYWQLRDYGVEGQLGMEPTPEGYVEAMRDVFREIRRVLRDDGVVWLNLGDTYSRGDRGGVPPQRGEASSARDGGRYGFEQARMGDLPGIKPKDLVGIPWMTAFGLRADGWYLRSDIIWAKGWSFHPERAGSVMPESVTDRPTRSHEHVFLLTKSDRYYYDAESVREAGSLPAGTRAAKGSRVGDTVLDPFCGTGTTGVVCIGQGRHFVGVELSPASYAIARRRLHNTFPMFAIEVVA